MGLVERYPDGVVARIGPKIRDHPANSDLLQPLLMALRHLLMQVEFMAGAADTRADHGQIGVGAHDAKTSEILLEWRSDAARARSPAYVAQVAQWVDQLATHAAISSWRQLEPRHVSTFLDSLQAAGRKDAIGRPLKPGGAKTVNNALTAIRSFLAWCVKREYLTRNVAESVSWSKHTKVTRRAFTPAEVHALIAAAEERGAPERAMLYAFLAMSGCRIGTAERLRRKHIDLSGEQPVIVIPAALLKQRRDMRVPMSAQHAPFIMAMLKNKADPNDLLFGERPHRNVILRDCDRANVPRKDAYGRGAGFHCFRRFVGTELARARISPKVARDRLGHKDIRTTLEFYTDEFGLEDIHAANLLASKVYGDTHNAGRQDSGGQVDKLAETRHHCAADSAMSHTPQNLERRSPGESQSLSESAPFSAEPRGLRSSPAARQGSRLSSTRASGVEPDARETTPGRASVDEVRLQELRLAQRVLDLIERLLVPGRSAHGAADVDSSQPVAHARKGQDSRTHRAS